MGTEGKERGGKGWEEGREENESHVSTMETWMWEESEILGKKKKKVKDVESPTLTKNNSWGWSNSTAGTVFALHTGGPGSILSITSYGLLSTIRSNSSASVSVPPPKVITKYKQIKRSKQINQQASGLLFKSIFSFEYVSWLLISFSTLEKPMISLEYVLPLSLSS